MTSELAPGLIEQIKNLENALEKKNKDDLIQAKNDAVSFIDKNILEPIRKAEEEKRKAEEEKRLRREQEAAQREAERKAKQEAERKEAERKAAQEKINNLKIRNKILYFDKKINEGYFPT